MPNVDCVNESDLRAFLLGELPRPIADLIAKHLDDCPDCETVARRLDGLTDSVVRTLRRAVDSDVTQSKIGAETPDSIRATDAEGAEAALAGAIPPGYELVGELGRGGTSVVYHALQRHPRRPVALKMIPGAAHAGAVRKARFLAEADAIARLHHSNIVTLYEVGEHAGLPFLSLEYVAGGTLADRLAGAPLPARSAAALIESLARAVQYAHDQGVVHRDLKPTNVLLSRPAGEPGIGDLGAIPKITDFGLAKQVELALTATGDILGTPQYMAPEQADGRKVVGPPADVYALGAIFYECLTGRPPFRGASALETLDLVRSREPVAPRVLQPGLRRDLETICLKCLEKEPARRYVAASDLADDLRRFQAGEPIEARPAGAWDRGRNWVRRRPAAAAAITLTVLLAVGGTAAAWMFKGQRDEARAARADAFERLRESLVARARAGRTSGRPGRRLDSLEALSAAARLRLGQDLRDEAIACLTTMDLRIARRWPIPPGDAEQLDFDDAFSRYVWVSADGRIRVRRLADDAGEMEIPGLAGTTWVALSPDGRFLCVMNEPRRRRQVWRLDGPAPVAVVDASPADRRWASSFRPDSGRFAVARPDGAIALYDLPSGKLAGTLPARGQLVALAYDPAGRRLAAVTSEGVFVRDAETGAGLADLPVPCGVEEGLAWHPAGDLLAVTGGDGVVVLWDVNTGRPVRAVEGRRFGGVRLTFNHAGDLLAGTSWDGRLRLCDTATGRQVFTVPFATNAVRFRADDRCLGGDRRNGEFILWEVERGREYRTLVRDAVPERAFSYGQPAVSPDGKWVAAATDLGIGIWELATGRQRAVVAAGQGRVAGFDAAGGFLAAGEAGPQRWLLTPAADGTVCPGPPERLPLPGFFTWLAGTPDGRALAGVEIHRGVVVHRDRPDKPVWLRPLIDARDVAISPDGRRVVTGDHAGDGLTVWDAETGRAIKHLCPGHLSRSVFSPDGRFLAGGYGLVDSKAFVGKVWETGTWAERAQFVGMPLAFSPDGAAVAVETGQGGVWLLAPETGAVIARLEVPNLERAEYGCFTPDGGGLVLSSNDGPAIHVWDLRLIRNRLAERGLDWNAAAIPPPAATPGSAVAEKLEVIAGARSRGAAR